MQCYKNEESEQYSSDSRIILIISTNVHENETTLALFVDSEHLVLNPRLSRSVMTFAVAHHIYAR